MPPQRRNGIVVNDKTPERRQLLRRYVDLAFAKEDQIMCGTKTGTSVGFAVADYFSFGLTTVIGKSVETSVIATVRGVRRTQAAQMFVVINTMAPGQLQALAALAAQQGEPGFDWLRTRLTPAQGGAAAVAATATAAASSAASSAASTATTSVGSIVQDIFVDYLSDAIFDQALSMAPFGIGAVKSGIQVAQVTQRIEGLRVQIQTLKAKGA